MEPCKVGVLAVFVAMLAGLAVLLRRAPTMPPDLSDGDGRLDRLQREGLGRLTDAAKESDRVSGFCRWGKRDDLDNA